jgi:hypothetical protein
MNEPAADLRVPLLWAIGLVLIIGGVVLAIWLVSIVYTGLFHPTEIPILNAVLERIGDDASILKVLSGDGTFTIKASDAFSELAIAVVVLILVGTLGSIVHGLISGGTRLVGKAMNRSSGAGGERSPE